LAFSRPWPSRTSPKLSHAPLFYDDVGGLGEVEQVAFTADAGVEHDLEFGLAEGGGHLVLDDLGLHAVAGRRFAFLDVVVRRTSRRTEL